MNSQKKEEEKEEVKEVKKEEDKGKKEEKKEETEGEVRVDGNRRRMWWTGVFSMMMGPVIARFALSQDVQSRNGAISSTIAALSLAGYVMPTNPTQKVIFGSFATLLSATIYKKILMQ